MGSAITDDDRWSAWCADFDDVEQEMTALFHTRWMWKTIAGLVDHAVTEQYVVVQNYLVRTYVTTVASAVRREADRDDRTTSLARCLQALIDCPHFASRSRFRALIDEKVDAKLAEEIARDGFDLFGPGSAEFVDPSVVSADLERLHAAAAPIRKYTNKVIAHRERRPGQVERVSVSMPQLDHALDVLGDITKKYYRLRHPGVMLGGLTPLVDLSFLHMFEVPWYSEGFVVPDVFDND